MPRMDAAADQQAWVSASQRNQALTERREGIGAVFHAPGFVTATAIHGSGLEGGGGSATADSPPSLVSALSIGGPGRQSILSLPRSPDDGGSSGAGSAGGRRGRGVARAGARRRSRTVAWHGIRILGRGRPEPWLSRTTNSIRIPPSVIRTMVEAIRGAAARSGDSSGRWSRTASGLIGHVGTRGQS
jgi:hypothetical protein